MTKSRTVLTALLAAAGVLTALPFQPAQAQGRTVQPERALVNVSLGRPFLEVIRRFGQPSEVQTVALAVTQENLPGLGGGAAGGEGGLGMSGFGAPGMMGAPGMGGGYPGMPGAPGAMGGMGMGVPFGGGSPFGGGLPPAGGGMSGGSGYPGAGGFPGAPGGAGGYPGAPGGFPGGEFGPGGPGAPGAFGAPGAGGPAMPEYSNAILWIYKLKNDARLEFLINEDGRIAQISLAAPADKSTTVSKGLAGAKTSKNISLGSNLTRVMDAYGYPERHRILPGLRFYEVYYSKNYHAAFTFDTQKSMRCVRITIALAD